MLVGYPYLRISLAASSVFLFCTLGYCALTPPVPLALKVNVDFVERSFCTTFGSCYIITSYFSCCCCFLSWMSVYFWSDSHTMYRTTRRIHKHCAHATPYHITTPHYSTRSATLLSTWMTLYTHSQNILYSFIYMNVQNTQRNTAIPAVQHDFIRTLSRPCMCQPTCMTSKQRLCQCT